MTTARVKIDVPTGVVELEGDTEFVSEYLDKLLSFIEEGGFGTQVAAASTGADQAAPTPGEGDKEQSQKRVRKASKRPPAGSSCRDRMLTLRKEGFFTEHRTPKDICKGLADKGFTHKPNQVSAALVTMFNNGEIQRTKSSGKGFDYFWDRG